MKTHILFFILLVPGIISSQLYTYGSDGNLKKQALIETSDNNLLIVSAESCYTGAEVVIEGCVFALHIAKITLDGDTLWTKEVSYTSDYAPKTRIYENQDGSFSIIVDNNQSYTCEGLGVAISGLFQYEIIHLSSHGELLHDTRLPDDCELHLYDAERVSDKKFVVFAVYEQSLVTFPPYYESRLTLLDHEGSILEEIILSESKLRGGQLWIDDEGLISLLLIPEDGVIKINKYTAGLELVTSIVFDNFNGTVFGFSHVPEILPLKDGTFAIASSFHSDTANLELLIVDPDFNIIGSSYSKLMDRTRMVEDNDNHILIGSNNRPSYIEFNVLVNYYDVTSADSLYSKIFDDTLNMHATQIFFPSNGEMLITGNRSCCIADTITGPSQTFLLNGNELITDIKEISSVSLNVYPNPAESVIYIESGNGTDLKNLRILLFSPLGQTIIEKQLTDNRSTIQVEGLGSGLYYYSILHGGEIVGSGKLVKL